MTGSMSTHSSERFLRTARRVFPNTVPFQQYCDELPSNCISLQLEKPDCDKTLRRLVERLYVAWPSTKSYPKIVEVGRQNGSISLDQILHDVILACLRRYPCAYLAQNRNVLCNGFLEGSQHGKGSVFAGLDVRSTSAQIQALRSPVWKLLLRCIGPALLRHLLANNVLLLSIEGSQSAAAPNRQTNGTMKDTASLVFLQLCGPPPRECEAKKSAARFRNASDIVVKQDLLYHTPTHRENAFTRSLRNTLGRDDAGRKTHVSYNDGLPKSHHLQGLLGDHASAKKLAMLMFPTLPPGDADGSKANSSAGEKAANARNRNLEALPSYDRLSIGLDRNQRRNKRGSGWLQARKSSFGRLSRVVPLLQKVIKRTHKFSFRRVLGKTCPLPTSVHDKISQGSASSESLIRTHCDPREVAKFLIACVRQMIPTELLGSKENRTVLENHIQHFVCRRLKRESLSIQRFSTQAGLRLSDVSWLYGQGPNGKRVSNPTELRFRRGRITQFYCWLFRGVLLPLLHQNFYITDGDLHRNRVFFFRREVWSELADVGHSQILLAEERFSILSQEKLLACVSKRFDTMHSLGLRICPYPVLMYHQLRFVPKRSSLRAIQRPKGKLLHGFAGWKDMHMSGRTFGISKMDGMRTVTKAKGVMKKVFRHILKVLSSEACSEVALGASVFSLDDIYKKMLTLKSQWRSNRCPKMYLCCVDIKNSFDTIPLQTLFSDVVPSLLSRERYACLRYAVAKGCAAPGRVLQRHMVHVCAEPGEEASFMRVTREKLSRFHSGGVFVDMVQTMSLSREEILKCLREFLMGNIIAIPRRNRKRSQKGFAVQRCGLPQGHPLSSLLTSLFYAHVENQDLSEFVAGSTCAEHNQNGTLALKTTATAPSPNLLMRVVDDTLYLTSDKGKAQGFLNRMETGWKTTHGVSVNVGKTRCSFSSDRDSPENAEPMPWCGLLIHPKSLEVTVDFARYGQNDGSRLRDTLSIEHDYEVGRVFAQHAQTCFKPKMHPMLLDAQMNSRSTVALNLYQAALLSCLKLSAYAREILPTDSHLMHVMTDMLSNFQALVYRSVASRAGLSVSCTLPLSPVEVRYLITHAFQRCVKQRLAQCRGMQTRVLLCQDMLEQKLADATKAILDQKGSRVQDLAERISERSCDVLWNLKL